MGLLDQALADLRQLDELAARSGVSRAMISKIERQASTPTAETMSVLGCMGRTSSSLTAPE